MARLTCQHSETWQQRRRDKNTGNNPNSVLELMEIPCSSLEGFYFLLLSLTTWSTTAVVCRLRFTFPPSWSENSATSASERSSTTDLRESEKSYFVWRHKMAHSTVTSLEKLCANVKETWQRLQPVNGRAFCSFKRNPFPLPNTKIK